MAKCYEQLNLLFAALGDSTRRQVIARLTRGPATVSELAAGHDMALPSFLGHLRRLEAAGLIATGKTGRVRTCALVPNATQPAQAWLDQQRALWEGNLDRFGTYVTKLMETRTNGPRSED